MGGKSKKVTVGYWYYPAYHAGLCVGEIDAFLEFRGGNATAWAGNATQSQTIHINAPKLWGGEKDQGGIVGDVDLLFGEPGQAPNAYLKSVFGPQVPAWRGLTTLVFKGGKYGAMNPYPQPASYKVRKIRAGWDGPCWYPEKAEITMIDGMIEMLGSGWEYQLEVFSEPNTVWNNFSIPVNGWLQGGQMPFNSPTPAGGEYWRPYRSNIWVRRRMRVNTPGVRLQFGADNGCVLFINGVQVGVSNPTNAPISSNEQYPVVHELALRGEVEVVGKAYAEVYGADDAGNVVDVSFTATGSLKCQNPAHALYYARTHADLGREPVANMNDASYRAAADRLYAEGFGICWTLDPSSESLEEFEDRICRLIGGSVSRSLTDGRYHLDLARDGYNIDSLPVITDDDILDLKIQSPTLDGAVNSLSVKYFDPDKKEEIVTPPVQALALIDAFGTIHQTVEYPEIPTGALAALIAERDLRAGCTPKFVLELTVIPDAVLNIRPSMHFRLKAPKRRIADMVLILGEKQAGTLRSGAVKATATQDVYGLPATAFVQVEPGVDTTPDPTAHPVVEQAAFEAPYIEVVQRLDRANLDVIPPDAGYLLAVAAQPAAGGKNFDLVVADAGGEYLAEATGEWSPLAVVAGAAGDPQIGPGERIVPVSSIKRADEVVVGSAAVWGGEIVRVDAIDASAGTVTLGRGCADTVAASHPRGSLIWFYDDSAVSDLVERSDGEVADIKLLTNTGTSQADPALTTALSIGLDLRHGHWRF